MKLGITLAIPVTILVGAMVWLAGGERTSSTERAQPTATATTAKPEVVLTGAPRERLPTADFGYHGVAWQIHYAPLAVEQAHTILPEIADLGADTVLISNAGYQEHAASKSFQIDPRVTPSAAEWEAIIDIAHHHGLRVVLMPIILLSEPRGNEWRGVIKPPSWDDWFEQYERFVLHFAKIAADNDVDVFMVGSELVSTEKYTDQWRKVIRSVRKAFPGKLSYSANWDHYKVIQFWDDLDLVGMTSYYKLSSTPRPALSDLIESWAPLKRGLLRWQERVGKPLLFTEVGWCSQEGAAIEPWNYYRKQEATPEGLEEQRRCYRAFMETWRAEIWPTGPAKVPPVGGAIWWEWNSTPGGEDDYNYIPKGKPAEQELREWFESIQEKRLPQPAE